MKQILIFEGDLASTFMYSSQMYAEEAKRHPIGRIGTSLDIAHAVEFLASGKASWITGENIIMDGGRQWDSPGVVPCDHYKTQKI